MLSLHPQILIFCIFTTIQFTVFFIFLLRFPLWPMKNLELYGFQVFGDFFFGLPVFDFYSDFTVVEEYTLYGFSSFKFIEVCLMSQDILVYIHSICFLLLSELFIVCQILLVEDIVKFYILDNFLLFYQFLREVLKFPFFIYFSQVLVFLHIYCSSTV